MFPRSHSDRLLLMSAGLQDAEEFLCQYLDALDEELPALLASSSGRQSASAALEVEGREVSQSGQTEVGGQGFVANLVESPITRIFGGKFRSPVLTPNQSDPVPTEGWRSLHLDIRLILSSPFKTPLFYAGRPIRLERCEPANAHRGASTCSRSPSQRVRYDATAGGIMKIGKLIQFGPELEVPLDIMVPNAQRPSEPPHYKLYGVLYHHGESAGSGHYTIDVLHRNGDGNTGEDWLHIDNEAVTPMRDEDVFGVHELPLLVFESMFSFCFNTYYAHVDVSTNIGTLALAILVDPFIPISTVTKPY
ncbi:hypothetical protein BGY98DRAFT_939185 [Russula aff. rugulosa BPL654]|nr:hypothetical protein BGY98DRAFT_939185 [Russula aff. rugulosa BPL654]